MAAEKPLKHRLSIAWISPAPHIAPADYAGGASLICVEKTNGGPIFDIIKYQQLFVD
jgi:hypothetical protein